MELCGISMEIDNLPKEKLMQLYQDLGIAMGFKVVANTFTGKETYSQSEIVDFCNKSAQGMEKQVEQFMKDNDIEENTVVETN